MSDSQPDPHVTERLIARVNGPALSRALTRRLAEANLGHFISVAAGADTDAGALHETLSLLFSTLSSHELPADEIRIRLRANARQRSDEGVPLDELLAGYRSVLRWGWEALLDAAERADEREVMLRAGPAVMAMIDAVSSTLISSYYDQRQFAISEDARLVVALIDALCDSAPIPETLRGFAARIGVPIAGSYRPFAMTIDGVSGVGHAQAAAALRLRGVLAMSDGSAVVGLARSETGASTLVDHRALLALEEPRRREELGEGLTEARQLLDIARRAGQRTGVVDPIEFGLPLLVAASPRLASQIRRRILDPLEAYEGGRTGELLRTLRTYFTERLNRSRTAAALNIHPNTLDYRLGRIEELCDINLSVPGDIARIEIALTAADQDNG